MKQTRLLFILGLLTFFTSCKKDDDPSTNTDTESVTAKDDALTMDATDYSIYYITYINNDIGTNLTLVSATLDNATTGLEAMTVKSGSSCSQCNDNEILISRNSSTDSGTLTISYTVQDGDGNTSTGTITVAVTEYNVI